MQYLSLALYAEGPTDYRFLSPLLQRLCEDICLHESRGPVEISEEVLPLNHPEEMKKAHREERILSAARMARGAWRLLFIHADGEADPDGARKNLVEPALTLLRESLPAEGVAVGVVPVYETESWILSDTAALRKVFGTTLNRQALGLPAASGVEKERDPKAVLRRCFDLARPGARHRCQSETLYFQRLGDCISLDELRRQASFQRLEADLRVALRALQIIAD